MKQYYVYILASRKNGTLYVGMTHDLIKRAYEHKSDLIDGFTKKYKVHRLVYYEETNDPQSAILREKQMKKWNRQWKIELIEALNLNWEDLYEDLVGSRDPRFSPAVLLGGRGDDSFSLHETRESSNELS